jgi:hypothetical protein
MGGREVKGGGVAIFGRARLPDGLRFLAEAPDLFPPKGVARPVGAPSRGHGQPLARRRNLCGHRSVEQLLVSSRYQLGRSGASPYQFEISFEPLQNLRQV